MYLGGGGTADDERPVWEAALAGCHTVLYWPFALPVAAHAESLFWLDRQLAPFGSFGIEMWSTLGPADPAALDRYDLLFVGGGNTYALLDEIGRHGWLVPVGAWIRGGGRYYGGSAGAVLAGADVDVAGEVGDPNEVGLTGTAALNLLGGRDLWPHFAPSDVAAARAWAARTGRPVLGVPEQGGLLVDGGVIRCAGPSAVHVVEAGSHRVLAPGDEIDI